MKFMVKWSIDQDKWVPILKAFTSMTPAQRADAGAGATIVGRWHDVNARCGVAIMEASTTAALAAYLNRWNTMCDLEVAPVLDDEEAAVVGTEALKALGA